MVESFSQELSRIYYLQGAGLGSNVNVNDVYSKYPSLFTDENQHTLEIQLKGANNTDDKNRLKKFLEAFYCERISESNKHLNEELFSAENSKIEVDGSLRPYRNLMISMYNEKDVSKKKLIRKKLDEFTSEKLNPLLKKIFLNEVEYINRIGFSGKIEMFTSLTGIDLYSLNSKMQRFLALTEDIYMRILEKIAREKLNLTPKNLKRDDLNILLRGHEYDPLFPKDKMIKIIYAFTSGIGLDMLSGNKITYDLEARDNKSYRAFCSPVRIPEEIYLVVNPMGGAESYSAFLHELGHAMHYAGVSSLLPFEHKWYGDNSVTEAYAMTFDHLISNEKWMKEFMGDAFSGNSDYFKHRAFNELVMLRGFAAKLDYEIKLNESKDLSASPEVYKQLLQSAMKVGYSAEMYMTGIDPYFYIARYIRAYMLRSNIHKYFNETFGDNWFKVQKTGDMLMNLWSTGQKYNADEISGMLGMKLSIDPLVENINRVLSN
jgi:hypothetical protein